jgi:hypothetical protein
MKDCRSIGIQAASLYSSYEFYFGKRGGQASTLANQETKPMSPSIQFKAFHNALRILHSLDYHEVSFLNVRDWDIFRDNPYEFFITTNDAYAILIWEAIQKRQPPNLRPSYLGGKIDV